MKPGKWAKNACQTQLGKSVVVYQYQNRSRPVEQIAFQSVLHSDQHTMRCMEDCSIHALQAVTRFLLPFRIAPGKMANARLALHRHDWAEHGPNRNYKADFTTDFLARCFGVPNEGGATQSNLLQWSLDKSKERPGSTFNVTYRKETFRAALWNRDGRDIELFLADQGVGVLSITVCLAESLHPQAPTISMAKIKSFNYALSQDPARKGLCAVLSRTEGKPYPPV